MSVHRRPALVAIFLHRGIGRMGVCPVNPQSCRFRPAAPASTWPATATGHTAPVAAEEIYVCENPAAALQGRGVRVEEELVLDELLADLAARRP
jgi:hypothetical protein